MEKVKSVIRLSSSVAYMVPSTMNVLNKRSLFTEKKK
jgi:hypothetical protein